MVNIGKICNNCHCELKKYDKVYRTIRVKGGVKMKVKIQRYQCPKCKHIYRELPEDLYPHKQYESEIIDGVVEGLIDSSTLGFEDYPCEMTMKRWRKEHAESEEE